VWLRAFEREPDPHRPLDGKYVQIKWVRLHRMGPLRAATLVVLVMMTSWVALTSLIVATVPPTLLGRVIGLVIAVAIVCAFGWFVVRIALAGVYVNDRAVRLLSLRGNTIITWDQVIDVRRVPGPQPVLGLRGVWRAGERVQLVLTDGDDVATPLSTASVDLIGRAETYDVAALALEDWWQKSRSS
jgi:uncharacterized membrane protein (DUF485 family)